MKHTLMAGIVSGLLLAAGCQSLNWTAKNKSPSGEAVAQSTTVREVPWTWRKQKSTPNAKSDLPPEIQAKFDQAKDRAGATKSSAQWYAEGSQLELAGNFAAATKAYESAISVDPLNADAHHRLGIMSDMRQEYGTAEDHYKAALRQKPHDPNILSDFGYSNSLRGNVQQSERYLLQALDLDSQHKHALKNLGSLYASQGRYDDALQAFRRLRPEAEAQQLMSQYFPKGRPIPDGDNVHLASAKNANGSRSAPPAAADNIDPAALKNKSPQEIKQLMEQRRLEAEKQREQRNLAESRPNLQQSMTQDEWARLPSGPIVSPGPANGAKDVSRSSEWTQNPPPAAPGRDVPPNLAANGNPSTSASMPMAANPSSPGNMPIWNGRTDTAPPSPVENYGAVGANASPVTQQPPSWWNEDGTGRAPTADAYAFDSQRAPAAPTDALPSWGGMSNFTAGNTPPARNNPAPELTTRQRAYQLGMSAGPGTMFPAMPAEMISNVTNHQPAAPPPPNFSGNQWSNSNTPGGYQESRAVGSPQNFGNAADNWQTAPVDVAPRSPTENWDSPASVPWPDRALDQAARETPPMRPPFSSMPVVTPQPGTFDQGRLDTRNFGSSMPVVAGAPEESQTAPASGTSDGQRSSSDVVPAWYGSPAAQPPRPRSATPVPQWPYAPK